MCHASKLDAKPTSSAAFLSAIVGVAPNEELGDLRVVLPQANGLALIAKPQVLDGRRIGGKLKTVELLVHAPRGWSGAPRVECMPDHPASSVTPAMPAAVVALRESQSSLTLTVTTSELDSFGEEVHRKHTIDLGTTLLENVEDGTGSAQAGDVVSIFTGHGLLNVADNGDLLHGAGSILWQMRAHQHQPIIEFDYLHSNHDTLRPSNDVRIVDVSLNLPTGWRINFGIPYPEQGGAPGGIIESTGRTALMIGRHMTRRMVIEAPGADHQYAARISNAEHYTWPLYGEPRSWQDTSAHGAVASPHGDRVTAWGMEPLEVIRASVAAEASDWNSIIVNDGVLPGDNNFPQAGRAGAIWLHGSTYGGPTGGDGLAHRFCHRELLASSAEAVRLLRMKAWAKEGRGLGLVWHNGRSFELPTKSHTAWPAVVQDGETVTLEQIGVEWPAYTPQGIVYPGEMISLEADSLGSINYFITPSPEEWGPAWQQQGWMNADPFGFTDLPKLDDTDANAAHREAESRSYGWIDRQHFLLQLSERAALAAMTNDWISKQELIAMGDACRLDSWDGLGSNAEHGGQFAHVLAHPEQGFAPGSRQLAETMRAQIEAYTFEDPIRAVRFERGLRQFEWMIEAGRIPSGWTRDHGHGKIAEHVTPDADYPANPMGVSQSWYAALLADAAWGASVALNGINEERVIHVIDAMRWWAAPGVNAFLNYAAVAENAASDPYPTQEDVPTLSKSTAPGATSGAYDNFYHYGGIAAGIDAAAAVGDWVSVALASWVLVNTVPGGDVQAFIASRAGTNAAGMDAPMRVLCEKIEQYGGNAMWQAFAHQWAMFEAGGGLQA